MGTKKNRFGLSRSIPENIKLEIRQRSKFGCVVCRNAVVEYEHIIPEFREARLHDPSKICGLCGSCHDKVTRGQFSKEYIAKKHKEVQESDDVAPASDVFDLHTGEAKLTFGGNNKKETPRLLLSYYGKPVFQVAPNTNEPGAIYAQFNDENDNNIFQIVGEKWTVINDAWDINVVGSTITVKSDNKLKVLKLRIEPPGKIVIEHLDMKFKDVHIMATEHGVIIGRYRSDGISCGWLMADAKMKNWNDNAVYLSVYDPINIPHSMGSKDGITFPQAGLSIASNCLFSSSETVIAVMSVHHVRKYFFTSMAESGLPKLINGNHFLLLKDEFIKIF